MYVGVVSTMVGESMKRQTSGQTYTRLHEDLMAMFFNLFVSFNRTQFFLYTILYKYIYLTFDSYYAN